MTDDQLHRLHVLAGQFMTGASLTAAACFDDRDDRELGDALADASRTVGTVFELLYDRLWPDG